MTSVPFYPNFRIGLILTTGALEQDQEETIDNSTYLNNLSYSYSVTGISLGRAFSPVKTLAIVPSVSFLFSSNDIQISKVKERNDWSAISASSSNEFYHRIQSNSFSIEPTLNIEWKPANIIMLRAAVSYSACLAQGDWTLNSKSVISKAPDKLSPSGINLRLGIFIGLMDF